MTTEKQEAETLLARFAARAPRLMATLRRIEHQVELRTSLSALGLLTTILFLVGALFAFGYGVALVGIHVWYESLGPYNVDTPLYWTVGRGMVHGLVPYRDLYETKPPGIFLLSALSFLLTSDFKLTHVTQIASIVFVALSPLAFVRGLFRSRRTALLAAPEFFALWAIVLLIEAYVADRGDSVQVETHGLVGAVAFTLLVGKRGRLAFLGRALGVLVCVGMKEPFFLLLPAVYMLTLPAPGRAWPDLLGPVLLASAVGSLGLIACGWFTAYTGIYLKSMLGAHVHLTGSPIARTVAAFNLTWDDLHAFAALLPATLVYCMGLYLFLPERAADGTKVLELVGKRFQALMLGLLLAGLAVGMGGTFFVHHYIFAVPLFLAVLFTLMRRVTEDDAKHNWMRAGFVCLALAAVTIPWVPAETYRARADQISAQDTLARKSAVAIDSVLDRLKVDRYLYLGPGGYLVTPFTRHTPLGPLFWQQVMFFGGQYPWLVKRFKERLDEAQVVVMNQHVTGPADPEVAQKLAVEFRRLPAKYIPAGMQCQYPILVRKTFALP